MKFKNTTITIEYTHITLEEFMLADNFERLQFVLS